MIGTIGKVVRGEIMMAEGFRGVGAAAGEAHARNDGVLGVRRRDRRARNPQEDRREDRRDRRGSRQERRGSPAHELRDRCCRRREEKGENVRKWVEANAKHSEFSEATNEGAYLGLKRFGVTDQRAGLFMKGAEDLAAVAAPDQREAVYHEALAGFARMHARGKVDARSAMRGFGFGVEDFAEGFLPGPIQGEKHKRDRESRSEWQRRRHRERHSKYDPQADTGEKGLGETVGRCLRDCC